MQRTDIMRVSKRPGRCNSFLPSRPWKQVLARSNLPFQTSRRRKRTRRALADQMDPQLPSHCRKQIRLWPEMAMDTHRRNTGPMLASARCGARTRSGKACMSPAVSGKRRCRCMAGHKDRVRRAEIRMQLRMDSTCAKLKPNGRKYLTWYFIRAT